mmetsp:Transcript_93626/g.279424  ORF Transcript_93626/g.279424 Transcript_93626/m.279424 type:complete len:204 (-) Transcript_93626:1006-1617(-)
MPAVSLLLVEAALEDGHARRKRRADCVAKRAQGHRCADRSGCSRSGAPGSLRGDKQYYRVGDRGGEDQVALGDHDSAPAQADEAAEHSGDSEALRHAERHQGVVEDVKPSSLPQPQDQAHVDKLRLPSLQPPHLLLQHGLHPQRNEHFRVEAWARKRLRNALGEQRSDSALEIETEVLLHECHLPARHPLDSSVISDSAANNS